MKRIFLSLAAASAFISAGMISYTYITWPAVPEMHLQVARGNNLVAKGAAPYVAEFESAANPVTWKIVAVGDLMADGPVQRLAERYADPEYGPHAGYEWILRHAAPWLRAADLTIGNLEFAAARSIPASGDGPFNGPPAYLDALESVGFDILFTANNHVLDAGLAGTEETLQALRERGIRTLGLSQLGEPRRETLLYDVEGTEPLRIAFLNYTKGLYGYSDVMLIRYLLSGGNVNYALFSARENVLKRLFGLVAGTFFPSALIPNRALFLENAKRNIAEALAQGAQFVVVYLHRALNEWVPSEDQRTLAATLCNYGADAIIGSGPHRLQPIEMIKVGDEQNKTQRECLVAYSLANFVSGWGGRGQFGAALEIDLEKHANKVRGRRATTRVIRGQISESQQTSCRNAPPPSGCDEGVVPSSTREFHHFGQ